MPFNFMAAVTICSDLGAQKNKVQTISNCQHTLDHRKCKRIPKKIKQSNIYFCIIDYAKAFECVDHNKLWKILKERGIPGHLTCLLRSLYADQEATVGIRHGKMDWFKTGKGVHQDWVKKISWSRK